MDFKAEGLILMTNSGEISQAIERNKLLEKEYKIRVFGRMFSMDCLQKIKRGIKIKDKVVKYHVNLINKQTTNSWINLKTCTNSIVDIRLMFRKLSLRINRLIRIKYGPFNLENNNEPGLFSEIEIPVTVSQYLMEQHRYKMNDKVEKVSKTALLISAEEKDFNKRILSESNSKLKKYKMIGSPTESNFIKNEKLKLLNVDKKI